MPGFRIEQLGQQWIVCQSLAPEIHRTSSLKSRKLLPCLSQLFLDFLLDCGVAGFRPLFLQVSDLPLPIVQDLWSALLPLTHEVDNNGRISWVSCCRVKRGPRRAASWRLSLKANMRRPRAGKYTFCDDGNSGNSARTVSARIGKQAERALDPLHVPGRDSLSSLDLLRDPFEAQSHVIEATRKALGRQKSLVLVGEMGTGKTLMGIAAVHAHAAGKPYRALVFCPGQLINKWEREIRETISDAEVIQLENWTNLLRLDRTKKPGHVEWYVIARDRAKLGAKWRPAFYRPKHTFDGFIRCPSCGRRLVDEEREPICEGKPGSTGQPGTGLWKRRTQCEWVLSNEARGEDGSRLVEGCGSPLWQMTGELWRYEPALFIKRHLRRYFKYLILDEVHEEKGAHTAQGHAAGLGGVALDSSYAFIKAVSQRREQVIEQYRDEYSTGAQKRGVDSEKARLVFDFIVQNAGLSFNKSHCAAFALIGYHSAYLKAHFRDEFMRSCHADAE